MSTRFTEMIDSHKQTEKKKDYMTMVLVSIYITDILVKLANNVKYFSLFLHHATLWPF